jgi:hypothetical protein
MKLGPLSAICGATGDAQPESAASGGSTRITTGNFRLKTPDPSRKHASHACIPRGYRFDSADNAKMSDCHYFYTSIKINTVLIKVWFCRNSALRKEQLRERQKKNVFWPFNRSKTMTSALNREAELRTAVIDRLIAASLRDGAPAREATLERWRNAKPSAASNEPSQNA